MKESLGLVETEGLVAAITVADAMVKSANVHIIELENTRGSGYMTVKISGDVGAVNAAVSCGKQIAIENNYFVSAKVIPRPSSNVSFTFCQIENNKKADEVNLEVKPEVSKVSEMNDIDPKSESENLEKVEIHLEKNEEVKNEDAKREKINESNKAESPNQEEKKSKRPRKKKADPKKE